MGYWTERDAEGPPKADGWGKFKVVRAITQKKDGGVITTKAGDRMVLCVLENQNGEESTISFTMSNSASWVLAKFLSRAGVDLEAFEERYPGLPPLDDLVKILEGKELYGYSEISGKYANFEPAHESEVPAGILGDLNGGGFEATDDDIPF